jgi:hypothetical protein
MKAGATGKKEENGKKHSQEWLCHIRGMLGGGGFRVSLSHSGYPHVDT